MFSSEEIQRMWGQQLAWLTNAEVKDLRTQAYELDRIQKYLDGHLIAPAPRGLVHRVAEAIEGRDARVAVLETALRKVLPEQDPLDAEAVCDYCGATADANGGHEIDCPWLVRRDL